MYGLLGKTLKHSFSKSIHESLGNPYQLIETNDLEHFFGTTDFDGLNVTIPYKEEVISYSDIIDPLVLRTNSCNTIVKINGLLYAYNTDYSGFIASLSFHHISLKNKIVAIVGNGATSRTIHAAAEDLGVKSILCFARHPKNDEYPIGVIHQHQDIDVLINTTPVGMYPNVDDTLPINISTMPSLKSVIDVIYNPLQTRLIQTAKDHGLQTMNGLYMLVSQAVNSYNLFHNKKIPDKQVLSLYRTLRKQQSNIVFIGMPKSGKSLYSKIYSEKSNRVLYDLDALFESKFKMSISTYFEQFGESNFRLEEANIIKEISTHSGAIISTGGGAILLSENILRLKQNGVIIFIDAPLDLLKQTGVLEHRPLLKEKEALDKLYNQRHQKYTQAADIIMRKESLHTTTNINTLEVLIYEYFGT